MARNIIQKVGKKQDEDQVWFLFVDYTKAFDSVFHDSLWKTLIEFGAPQHVVWLIKRLYDRAVGVVRLEEQHTEPFKFEKGVRQGCLISPILFNAIGERIMRKVEGRLVERSGKIIGGRCIWNIRYADDTTLVARSSEECNLMAAVLMEESRVMGLQINKSKTTAMTVHGHGDIEVEREIIEKVQKLKYLGSYITSEGDSSSDIKARIGMAKSVTYNLVEVWKSKELSLKLKIRLAKSLVWSIVLYACESWTLRKQEENMINVFEMWLWRRVLRVSWTQRKTNQWVRDQVGIGEEQGMVAEVKKRKIRKYGHWKRRGSSIVLATIEGETEGRGRRGRRKIEWVDNVIKWQDGIHSMHNNAKKECQRPN